MTKEEFIYWKNRDDTKEILALFIATKESIAKNIAEGNYTFQENGDKVTLMQMGRYRMLDDVINLKYEELTDDKGSWA